MTRQRKHPAEIRREAARLARDWADDREACGDAEGSGEMRDLARAIDRIRLTK